MKTSARNQLQGHVVAIRHGAINDEVELQLKGGACIVAVITHQSTQSLELAPGKPAIALIKAPWVILATDLQGIRLSARNRMGGTVSRVQEGAVNSEVVVDLGQGDHITAIVTSEAVGELGLKQGSPVTALFKASHVILGVPI